MSAQSNYQVLFSYLRSLNFHFLETWVMECVNYYKTINPEISLEDLKNEVKQQWLLVDLREIKVPSLPPDLKAEEKIILDGNYAVQVETMIDCSQSCYSQFRKLCKINDENIEATKKLKDWDVKSKRCLTFKICDGVQEIHAMEYQPIKTIRTNDPALLPGFKMVIMGPVECRRGMILLRDENVRVCGGEVDTLTTSNSLRSILLRQLDLDENDFLEESSHLLEKETTEAENADEGNVASLLSENEDVFLSLTLEAEIIAHEAESKKVLNEDKKNAECQSNQSVLSRKHSLSIEDIDTHQNKKLSLEPEIENNCSSVKENSPEVPEAQEIFLDDFEMQIQSAQSGAPKGKKPVQTKLSSFFKNNEFRAKNAFINQTPVYLSGAPFVYLKQILSLDFKKSTVFTVKAMILTLKKKITIEKNEYSLRASITDGSLCVDVDFSSEILEDLLGFSPCEMAVMMKAKQVNSAIAQRVKESFARAQEKLININCIMEVSFFPNGKTPLVVLLTEVTALHLDFLKKRNPKES